MTKYSTVRPRQRPKPKGPHPVWRGIGCLIIIVVPVISFALSKLLIDYGLDHAWAIPYQLLGNPVLPEFIYSNRILAQLLGPIATWTNSPAYLALGLLLMVILGGLLSFGYALIYRVIGPPRWGPLDMPPPSGAKPKPYKR